jgi:hypothetical protein
LGSGGGQRRPVALKDGQPGWKEYIAIRDTQKAAKSHDTTALQKRHGTERSELAAKLKAERSETLAGNWKGKGELRNAMQSVLATQQGAAKLELSERHRIERKELQARYKPLPVYKQWKEQPLIVGLVVLLLIDQNIERDRQPPALAQMLRSLSHNIDSRNHITYQFAGKAVFRDEGRTIQILDMKSDQGIAAALVTAQQKFGNVLTLTGSPEFQQNAVAIAVANGLTCRFADPQLDALRAQLQAEKYASERAAARAIAPPAKAISPPTAEPLKAQPPPLPQSIKSAPEVRAVAVELQAERAAVDAEPAQLADINKQIDTEKAYAHNHSLRSKPVVLAGDEAAHMKEASGEIIGNNGSFVAVATGREITIYRVTELEKHLKYDGTATGHDRFAKGNKIEIKRSGPVLSEEREAMKTEQKKQKERDHGNER